MEQRFDLTTFDLKEAFGQPGCAVCRLRAKAERRYLHSILYEYVNDGEIRVHLVRALGYCPNHAWMFQHTEQEMWGGGLGVGIIYEDLLGRAVRSLDVYGQVVKAEPDPRALSLWARLRRAWYHLRHGRNGVTPLPQELTAREACMACQMVNQSEDHLLIQFVWHGDDERFRSWFANSDGLCLTHFKRALELTIKSPSTRQFVAEVQLSKLKTLHQHLSEYLRKHNWSYRNEPLVLSQRAKVSRRINLLDSSCRFFCR